MVNDLEKRDLGKSYIGRVMADKFADDEYANDEYADDGNADDGNADDGNADDGNADDGNADDGNADDGNASDPRPGVIPTAAWSSQNFATASAEVRPPPPYYPVAETSQSEKTPMRGFSGRCHSCNRAETTECRRGPDGEGTLCNACGLRKISHSRLC